MKTKVSLVENKTTDYSLEYEPLSKFVSVEHFTQGKDLHVLSLKVKTTVSFSNNANPLITKKSFSSVLPLNIIEKHLADPSALLKEQSAVMVLEKESVAKFKKYGRYGNFTYQMNSSANLVKSENYLKDIENPNFMVAEMLNTDFLFTLKNSHGELMSEPMLFDYIEAQLHNNKYDLDLVAQHLIEREGVTIFLSDSRDVLIAPVSENDKRLSGVIHEIPSYNQHDGEEEFINFLYILTSDEIKKVMAFREDSVDKYLSHSEFVLHEILGCSQFLASPEETLPPKRKFKR